VPVAEELRIVQGRRPNPALREHSRISRESEARRSHRRQAAEADGGGEVRGLVAPVGSAVAYSFFVKFLMPQPHGVREKG
jgi:hypothetical protein